MKKSLKVGHIEARPGEIAKGPLGTVEIADGSKAEVPLIIVNCIIICRAEACASKNGLAISILDALGMGAGFTLILCLLAGIRELLATGMIFETPVMPGAFVPWAAMGMPVGAFITLGLILGLANIITKKKT